MAKIKMNTKDVSVVIQGAVDRSIIQQSIASIRKFLPEAEIVLSTWKGTDVEGLDVDSIVLNDDPGNVNFYQPDDDELPDYIDKKQKHNLNRQIVSSINGIKKAKGKYVLKFRTDLVLTGNSFLKYFKKYNKRNEECKLFKDRVITSIACRRSDCLPFHPGDWVFFGNKEDLEDLFDIPLAKEPEMTQYFYSHKKPKGYENHPYGFHRCKYITEQWIWYNFLKKHIEFDFQYFLDRREENIRLSDLSFANNLVILPLEQYNIKSLKYPDMPRRIEYCYYFNDWKYLYFKYCSAYYKCFSVVFENGKIKHKVRRLKDKLNIILLPLKNTYKWIKAFIGIFFVIFQLISNTIKILWDKK